MLFRSKDLEIKFNYAGSSIEDWDNKKVNVIGFEGATSLNRLDYNIGKSGGAGEDVKIEISLEAFKEL